MIEWQFRSRTSALKPHAEDMFDRRPAWDCPIILRLGRHRGPPRDRLLEQEQRGYAEGRFFRSSRANYFQKMIFPTVEQELELFEKPPPIGTGGETIFGAWGESGGPRSRSRRSIFAPLPPEGASPRNLQARGWNNFVPAESAGENDKRRVRLNQIHRETPRTRCFVFD